MEFENLLVEIDGPVATITLNRPESLNALNGGLQDDYDSALRMLSPGDDVRVVRVKGAGRAFCAGYDIAPAGAGRSRPEPAAEEDGDRSLASMGEGFTMTEREGMRQQVERWLRIWNYRKPIISQVHGYCLSGGLDLISTTDLVFAARGTRFGHPAARAVGIPILLGMLPLKIGSQRTKHLLFTGDLVEADQAKEWGLVHEVHDDSELDDRVLAYCRRIAMVPTDALTVHKQVVNRWSDFMGARDGVYASLDFDALYHTTPAYHEFGRRVMADGLQGALAWRDDPFKDSPR